MADEKEYPLFTPQGERAIIDDTRSWVDPRGYRLSDRLWQGAAYDRRAIDRVLRAGVQSGTPVLEVAKQLEEFLTPEGRVSRTRYPTGRGSGNAAARRLARTETSRAFNRASLEANAANPFVEASKWNLSGTHQDADRCDSNASGHSQGLGPGEYRAGEFPRIPDHPHCRCYVTPVTVPTEQALQSLVSLGQAPPQTAFQKQVAALRVQFEAVNNYNQIGHAEKLVSKAGALVRKQVEAALSKRAREEFDLYRKAVKADAAFEKEKAALWKTMQSTDDDALFEKSKARWILIRDTLQPAEKTKMAYHLEQAQLGTPGETYREAVIQAVSKVRSLGSSLAHTTEDFSDLNPTETAVADLFNREVRPVVPTEWWEESVNYGPIQFENKGLKARGVYVHRGPDFPSTLQVGGDEFYQPELAVHEFLHRVEAIRPRVRIAEEGFYVRRTKGEDLIPLGPGFEDYEHYRPDQFAHKYMGKDYGGSSWELATMGLQDALRHRGGWTINKWMVDDPEFADFILGLLAIG